MLETDHYAGLLHQLTKLRGHWRQRRVLDGALCTLAALAIVLIVVVGVDNLFRPANLVRLLLTCLVWGALFACLVRLILGRWLDDRRDDFFAALVEAKHPELRNRLINALQLGRGHQPGSPRFIAAIVRDAADSTADLEVTQALDRGPLQRSALLAGIGVVLVAGYATALAPWFGNGLARVMLPLADLPPYTRTRIVEASIKPGDVRVPEGSTLTIETAVSGIVPATAQLLRRTGEQSWRHPEIMQADRTSAERFRITLPQVSEPFDYLITAGDGQSKVHRVEVVKLPRIESLTVRYSPPAYTALPARQVTDGDGEISGIAGTVVNIEMVSTKPLREASLLTESGEIIPLSRGANDRTWQGSFVLWSRQGNVLPELSSPIVRAPGRYHLKLPDTEGYENADPLWRPISLAKDQPPTVAISEPGRDVQIRPDGAIRLSVDAADDYGVDSVRLLYRVNEDKTIRELARFAHEGPPQLKTHDTFVWYPGRTGLKAGDLVQYWAEASDRNNLTGPGQGESRRFSLFLLTSETVAARLELQIQDYAQALEELLRLQRENRAQTVSAMDFPSLVTREAAIRLRTNQLARSLEKDAFPLVTVIKALDELYAGLMADAVRLLERLRDMDEPAKIQSVRPHAVAIQDRIIAQLQELLARLQRNEQAREALRKLAKKDQAAHKAVTQSLSQVIKDLNKLLSDKTELAGQFEKMPKKTAEKLDESSLKTLKELEEFQEKWGKWAKGKVDELAKLPTGFVDDFGLRPDVNKIFEEIEKAANRPKAEKLEVSLEDLGASLATKMKEDLEVWMPDTPDAVKWVLEEPLDKKPMKIPEMPLPKALEDMIGDLLQKAEEFDEEADDVTSAWGDNLDQAGWGVSDGPISTFSAKGKTGKDMPNSNELTGRSGDGRRGKSTGQMVGDTSRALPGRKTPARVGNERYEPGQLKQEGQEDPMGATGGGKKAGAGRHGLQGGSPPDFVRDIGRLGEKQAGLREKAEQVAQKLESLGITSRRLTESIQLMKSAEKDLRDLRYDDAARKRRVALNQLKAGFAGVDQTTAVQLSGARELPAQLRTELLQATEEAYPEGYEALLKSYFRALSKGEK
jgi:hypothetical protein